MKLKNKNMKKIHYIIKNIFHIDNFLVKYHIIFYECSSMSRKIYFEQIIYFAFTQIYIFYNQLRNFIVKTCTFSSIT